MPLRSVFAAHSKTMLCRLRATGVAVEAIGNALLHLGLHRMNVRLRHTVRSFYLVAGVNPGIKPAGQLFVSVPFLFDT